MRQAYIIKLGDNSYDLCCIGLRSMFSMNVLATLNWKTYDQMKEWMEKLKDENAVFGLVSFYQFPQYETMPEIQVRLVKKHQIEYELHLNLGSLVLSRMNDDEFNQLYDEITMLVSQPNGSKVYFPALENKEK